LDLTSGTDFGLRIGLLVLLALVAGLIHRAGLDLSGPAVMLGLVAAATLVANLAVLIGLAGLVNHWPAGLIMRTAALEVVLNCALGLIMLPFVRWAVRRESALAL